MIELFDFIINPR